MAKKENKGGVLKNEDVEKELEIKGDTGTSDHPYKGSQDTGDDKPRIVETDRLKGEDANTKDDLQ